MRPSLLIRMSAVAARYLSFRVLMMLCHCVLVKAQNPLSDLGGWPSGAVTLLGGVYTSLRNAGQVNIDVLPPYCFSILWRHIPLLKKYLKSGERGSTFATLILETTRQAAEEPLRLEWDAVICSKRSKEFQTPSSPVGTTQLRQPSQQNQSPATTNEFQIDISSADRFTRTIIRVTAKGIDFKHLESATNELFKCIFSDHPYDLGVFLRKWRGFMIYENGQGMWQNNPPPDNEKLKQYVKALVRRMRNKQQPNERLEYLESLKQLSMRFLYSSPSHDDDELSPAPAWDNTELYGHELAALQAFSKAMQNGKVNPRAEVNPLLPCLQLWHTGKLTSQENLHITLDASSIFKVETGCSSPNSSGQSGSCPKVTLSYTLKIPNGPYNIDGLSAPKYAYPGIFTFWRMLWLTHTTCACAMVFFVMVASNATPTLATALALTYAVPFTNDHSWHDAGCPPSWNGRTRVRWGEGYSCGVFAGRYRGKTGRTGTSVTRCGIVLITSWATWARREQLRQVLEFGEERGISQWVKWVAVFIIGGCTIASSVHAFGLYRYGQKWVALFLGSYSGGFALTAFMFGWRVAHKQETWWISLLYSEVAFNLLGSFFPALVMIGFSARNGALALWSRWAWIVLVAVSCFNG